jgi:hypothetical protein
VRLVFTARGTARAAAAFRSVAAGRPDLGSEGDPRPAAAKLGILPKVKPSRQTLLVGLAAALIVGVAWLYFGGTFVKHDTSYAIVWGGQLLDGQLPDYEAVDAPTPHPLATVMGAVAALGGDNAYDVLSAIVFISLAALVLATYQLGREIGGSWPVGLLAAVVVATSFTMLAHTISGGFDVLVAALVVMAAVVEVRRPRCGAPVLLLLAAAGLQRPEAWLLSGAYWLYLAPELDWPGRLRLAVLAGAGPALWTASDLVVTGDPLFSFLDADKVADAGRRAEAAGVASGGGSPGVIEATGDGLRTILRLPILLGSLVGLAISLLALGSRVRVPLAVLVLWLVALVALDVGGLPVQTRFLLPVAAMLAIFFATGALGWIDRPLTHGSPRAGRLPPAAWPVAGALLIVAFVSAVPSQVDGISEVRQRVGPSREGIEDLDALARERRAASVLQDCPVYVKADNVIALLARATERPLGDIGLLDAESSPSGAFLAPTLRLVRANTAAVGEEHHDVVSPPAGYARVAANRSWSVWVKGCPAPAA